MFRALQKIVTNGRSQQVTIPRPLLHHVGWLPGQYIVIELLEDNTLRLRLPTERDVAPLHPPRLQQSDLPAVTK